MGAAARALDPGFRTVHPGAYDGQFYWGIAVDPLATGKVHKAFDKPAYRYGHPLYGWLGWLFSAGRPRLVPAALGAVGLASLFIAAAAAAALGVARGGSGWEGLFIALNPGLVSAAAHDLAEPLAAALLLGAFAAHFRGRLVAAWICLALLPLAKEPLLLVVLALVVWELVQRRQRRALMFTSAVIPALLWWTYVRVELDAWFTVGDTAIGRPLFGWTHSLVGGHHHRLSELGVAILVALLVVLGATGVRALRLRGPVDLCYLALATIGICLAPNAIAALTTALRNTALLLALVPFVIVSRSLLGRWNCGNARGHPDVGG
jgi:MFS family permease